MSALHWLDADRVPGLPDAYRRYLNGDAVGIAACPLRRPTFEELTDRLRGEIPSPVDSKLLDALRDEMTRLGAPPESHESLRRLSGGETWVVFAGQQPVITGGPLYTFHKAATAVAAAAALRGKGVEATPIFWIASDDADLKECGTCYCPGPDRALVSASLKEAYPSGTLAGDLPASEMRPAADTLLGALPPALDALLASCDTVAADFGSWTAAFLLRLFGAEGLIVVDSRLPALRRAAEPVFRRYLSLHAAVADDVNRAGDELESQGIARPVHHGSAHSSLFTIQDGRRVKLDPSEAGAAEIAAETSAAGIPAEALSPGVVLRPFAQDAVFPSIGTVVGPGELAYFMQTAGVERILGLKRGVCIPRLGASWVDRTTRELAAGDPSRWEALLEDPAPLVRDRLKGWLPERLRHALSGADAAIDASLGELAAAAGEMNRSLGEQVASGSRKIRHQLSRLVDQVLARARTRAAGEGEVLTNLRDYLMPRGDLQERSFTLLWPVARLGVAQAVSRCLEAAGEHLVRCDSRRAGHAMLSLEPDPGAGPDSTTEERWTRSFGSV